MGRRELILGFTAAVMASAQAQQFNRIRRIGFIGGGTYAPTIHSYLNGLPEGMHELGYVDGKDFVIEWRFAEGRYERFSELAAEMVNLKVEVLVLGSAAAVLPVQRVAGTTPIVMGYFTDPVGSGLIESLAHPGGNITGLAGSSEETAPKQVQLVRSVIPKISRIGLLQNPSNPSSSPIQRATEGAARAEAITVVPVDASSREQIDLAFTAFVRGGVEAVKVSPDALFMIERQHIAELVLANRLPSIFPHREYAEAGGLMSYGESLRDFFRRAARFVDKILKGARPGDLPIEQPTRFNLVINRRTAYVLGLSIPPQIYALADEVIE
jgi:putative tryptophan/tyrosine transport system substrate-binding protein